jgi:uncharacterized protein DUF6491
VLPKAKTMRKVLLAIAVLASTTAAPAKADRACLKFGYIYNWNALNSRTLIVEDEWHKKFKLGLIGICNNINYHERLAFESRGSLALSCLSPGDEVITREFGTGPSKCAITSIEAYTPEMEAADRAARAAKDHRQGY